ncbi:hypothetical protein [Paenibacillus hexagrammi]|uniref:DoxX family protein n=1 Tax=Paenibacillus hexagrammi TaxID=2908839 RepID=A0ABY3SCY7_9BACL|nr:hypothetical protein [Paenibacillus sp. YPD9-1]UJF31823.1 hypothetical protein L0M14_18895 [Paenibacillus sp. YPD9-1]
MYAHVKWFVDDHGWQPHQLGDIISLHFLFWLGITLFALILATIINDRIERHCCVSKFLHGLDRLKRYQLTIMRVGLGLGLSLQLFTHSYLAPTLKPDALWVYVVLILAIAGLTHRKLLPMSGIALAILSTETVLQYGLFHSLDYVFYAGIIYYLFAVNSNWNLPLLPVLYTSTGMSLAWLSMEKLTMPGLAESLIHEYGIPTFGFTADEFVMISAFIEIALGWSFVLGILNRFTAFLLSGMFLLTSLVFGFTEIVGHTVIHTLFIIFIIEGKGKSYALLQFNHWPIWGRCTFVIISFCLLLFSLMAIYIWMGGVNTELIRIPNI